MICCPACNVGADVGLRAARCRLCGLTFPISQGIKRDRLPHRGAAKANRKEKTKPEKYHGQPAGRITIPQYRWSGTRLG